MELALTGIQLAQSGRRAEALDTLRRAVQQPNAASNSEVWLWLAHVTPDLNEYRHCVAQALLLNPTHPIAAQMQSALQPLLPYPDAPALGHAPVIHTEALPRSRRRRRLRLLLLVILSLAGLSAILVLRQAADDESTDSRFTHTLSITANNRTFQVDVPQSWLVADRNDTAWQTARQALDAQWPELTVWDTTAVDLTTVIVQPSGAVQPPITIIETSQSAIARDQNNPLRLQWIRVGNVADTTCTGIRAYADEQVSQLQQTLQNNIVSTEVRETYPDYCLFVVHYRGQSPLSDEVEDIYVIHIPLGETTLAEWHLTVRNAAHEFYQEAIEQVLVSIRVMP